MVFFLRLAAGDTYPVGVKEVDLLDFELLGRDDEEEILTKVVFGNVFEAMEAFDVVELYNFKYVLRDHSHSRRIGGEGFMKILW